MKTEYVLPEQDQTKIDELNNRLTEIKMAYSEKISRFPFDEQRIRQDFMNNPTVKLIQQAISDVYMKSATKILVTLETEEEIKMFKDNWGLKENSHENNHT